MLENRRIYPETSRAIESCVKKHEIEKRSFLDGFRWFVVLLSRANTHIMVSLLNSRPTSCQSLEGMTSNRFSFRLTNKRYYWWSRRFLLWSSKCPKVCSRQWLNLYYQFNFFGGKLFTTARQLFGFQRNSDNRGKNFSSDCSKLFGQKPSGKFIVLFEINFLSIATRSILLSHTVRRKLVTSKAQNRKIAFLRVLHLHF